MKHVFQSGLAGQSNDAAGDAFLGGMIAKEWEEKLSAKLLRAEGLERENKRQLALIMALVNKAGGRVTLSESDVFSVMEPKLTLLTAQNIGPDGSEIVLVTRYAT